MTVNYDWLENKLDKVWRSRGIVHRNFGRDSPGPAPAEDVQTRNGATVIKLEPSHKSSENFLSKAPSLLLTRRKLENMDLDLSH